MFCSLILLYAGLKSFFRAWITEVAELIMILVLLFIMLLLEANSARKRKKKKRNVDFIEYEKYCRRHKMKYIQLLGLDHNLNKSVVIMFHSPCILKIRSLFFTVLIMFQPLTICINEYYFHFLEFHDYFRDSALVSCFLTISLYQECFFMCWILFRESNFTC